MAKTLKSKKISINAFDKIMKETYNPITNIEWNGIEIAIKDTLSLSDVLTFVNNVSEACFSLDTNSYLPEVKMFAIRCCVLEMYANFSLPTNIEHKYDLVYNTDAYDVIIKHINNTQFSEIIEAIDEKVKNMAQANIESVTMQMNELYSAFDGLQKQIENIFSGINSEDVLKLIGAVTDGKIDEEKLMQAYLDNNLNSNESD